jgi:hypothetical protein
MSIKGLEQAIENLNSISKTAVPRASAQAVNRVAMASRLPSVWQRNVAKDNRVSGYLVKLVDKGEINKAASGHSAPELRLTGAICRHQTRHRAGQGDEPKETRWTKK